MRTILEQEEGARQGDLHQAAAGVEQFFSFVCFQELFRPLLYYYVESPNFYGNKIIKYNRLEDFC